MAQVARKLLSSDAFLRDGIWWTFKFRFQPQAPFDLTWLWCIYSRLLAYFTLMNRLFICLANLGEMPRYCVIRLISLDIFSTEGWSARHGYRANFAYNYEILALPQESTDFGFLDTSATLFYFDGCRADYHNTSAASPPHGFDWLFSAIFTVTSRRRKF